MRKLASGKAGKRGEGSGHSPGITIAYNIQT